MRADVTDVVARLTGGAVRSLAPVHGGDIATAFRAVLVDGTAVFAKSYADDQIAGAEASSITWLAEAGAPVPHLIGEADGVLVLGWLDQEPAGRAAAENFGRALAALHAAGAPAFGADWPGYAGRLQVSNEPAPTWAGFYAASRVLPLVRQARDAGALDAAQTARLTALAERLPELAGPEEPPARLHGDLWAGNVLWTSEGAVMIDPAAYGGHRETDLAMLDLFGAPDLPRIRAAYQAATPLADGWAERVALHQVYPLLAHAVMFGGGYGARAAAVAARYA